ncbi:MAG: DUF805 domain-containing protein [Sphingobacteriia bacterium]|nr:DUF805 domain-containing protein [Sphingobacteriia bacterium]
MHWYLKALKQYATFQGRARRREFWTFTLINVVIIIALSILDMALGTVEPQSGLGMLSAIFILAILLPSLGVQIRRLHDINKSGWWVLIGLVPMVGSLVLLVFSLIDSWPTQNQYGPSPKPASA